MIRHFKWHKKRDESLQHGFMRYSPSDDCSDRFQNCTHNRKQTHYHCIQVRNHHTSTRWEAYFSFFLHAEKSDIELKLENCVVKPFQFLAQRMGWIKNHLDDLEWTLWKFLTFAQMIENCWKSKKFHFVHVIIIFFASVG